jgi:hypothetical protein
VTEYKIDLYREAEMDKEAIRNILIGRKVVSVELVGDNQFDRHHVAVLDNGTALKIEGNTGCGGCSEGWYSVDELNTVDNAILNVDFELHGGENEWGSDIDIFRIFVYAENEKLKFLEVSGHDNGYYGTGYWVTVALNDEP